MWKEGMKGLPYRYEKDGYNLRSCRRQGEHGISRLAERRLSSAGRLPCSSSDVWVRTDAGIRALARDSGKELWGSCRAGRLEGRWRALWLRAHELVGQMGNWCGTARQDINCLQLFTQRSTRCLFAQPAQPGKPA